jgi:hypothetical protein
MHGFKMTSLAISRQISRNRCILPPARARSVQIQQGRNQTFRGWLSTTKKAPKCRSCIHYGRNGMGRRSGNSKCPLNAQKDVQLETLSDNAAFPKRNFNLRFLLSGHPGQMPISGQLQRQQSGAVIACVNEACNDDHRVLMATVAEVKATKDNILSSPGLPLIFAEYPTRPNPYRLDSATC